MKWAALLLGMSTVACSSRVYLGEVDAAVAAREICGDGIDDDGDGRTDDGCPCGPNETQRCFLGGAPTQRAPSCANGVQTCTTSGSVEWGDWGDATCTPVGARAAETCNDVDDDCDGAADEGCPCAPATTRTCGAVPARGECRPGVQSCSTEGAWGDCVDAITPSAELCANGRDDDCDGAADEDCACVPAPEQCRDGIDNDCDGVVDERVCIPDWDGDPCDGTTSGPLPMWYAAAPTGQWISLPRSVLTTSGVGWTTPHPGGGADYRAVVTRSSGGILNTVGVHDGTTFVPGTFLVIFGGGESAWAGNELYAYGPLESDSPDWRRITDPTIPAPRDVSRDAANMPVARSTYDTLVFLPRTNRMLAFGAPDAYAMASSPSVTDVFDFATRRWSPGPDPIRGSTMGFTRAISGYDESTRLAWAAASGAGQHLHRYETDTGSLTSRPVDFSDMRGGAKAALHPRFEVLVWASSAATFAVDLRAASTAIVYRPTARGGEPVGRSISMDYDACGDRIVAWDETESRSLSVLTLPADPYPGGGDWTWSSIVPPGGETPGPLVTNGTFGRFRWNNGLVRGAVLMTAPDRPLHFFRP